MNGEVSEMTPNKSLQRTFDPPPIFATANTVGASNAAELRRCVTLSNVFSGRVAGHKEFLIY